MRSFSKKVYNVVSKIKKGTVLTYAQVAKKAGRPKAARAVGNILNRNPFLGTVPCHRVVRSDGRVGGYVFGGRKKEAILKNEGVKIKNGKIEY